MRLLFEMDKRDYDHCTHKFRTELGKEHHNQRQKDCNDS